MIVWALTSSILSSPKPLAKKDRVGEWLDQEQRNCSKGTGYEVKHDSFSIAFRGAV